MSEKERANVDGETWNEMTVAKQITQHPSPNSRRADLHSMSSQKLRHSSYETKLFRLEPAVQPLYKNAKQVSRSGS